MPGETLKHPAVKKFLRYATKRERKAFKEVLVRLEGPWTHITYTADRFVGVLQLIDNARTLCFRTGGVDSMLQPCNPEIVMDKADWWVRLAINTPLPIIMDCLNYRRPVPEKR